MSAPWLNIVAPLIVASACVVSFWPVLENGFVNWDDQAYLVENSAYHGLGWENIKWAFTSAHEGHYQPLSWLTWSVDYAIWGMNPKGYHLTNLILHAACAVVLYRVAFNLLRLGYREENRPRNHFLRIGALFAALLFAVHPLRVESVAWATERRDVLSGLFYWLSVLGYLRWARSHPVPDRDRISRRPVGAFVFFVMAVLSKSMSVSLPFVLLILDVYPLRRIRKAENGRSWIGIRPVLIEKVPFVVAGLVIGVIALLTQSDVQAVASLDTLNVFERLVLACSGAVFYILKTLIPAGLSPLYQFPLDRDIWHWTFMLSAVLFVLVTVGLLRRARRRPSLATAWICYVLMLAPVSGLLHSGPQIAADRYTYLPMVSLAVWLGGMVSWRWSRSVTKRRCVAEGALAAALLVALGAVTWKQCLFWRDSGTLWRRVLSVEPDNWWALNNLGIGLARAGHEEQAIQRYQQAIAVRPRFENAHHNLGLLLLKRGDLEGAQAHFVTALEINPELPNANISLGEIYLKQGRIGLAVEQYQRARQQEPDQVVTLVNLGHALNKLDRYEEAIPLFSRALEIDPALSEARHNLGLALMQAGRPDEASEQYMECLRRNPNDLIAAERLGVYYISQGRFREALGPLGTVARLQPNEIQPRTNLGYAQMQAGLFAESLETLLQAHQVARQHLPTSMALAWLKATCPVAEIRDGAEAVRLATELAERTGYRNPRVLDALGAAYAELGLFEDAVRVAQRASALSRAGGKDPLASEIESRIRLYEADRPYRQLVPSSL